MAWKVASDIDKRIFDLRKALGFDDEPLPEEDLAERAGVNKQQIGEWESGTGQRPSRSRLEKWARREGWPWTIFAEGGPMPSEVVNGAVNGTTSGGPSSPVGQQDAHNRARIAYRRLHAYLDKYEPDLLAPLGELYALARAAKPETGGEAACEAASFRGESDGPDKSLGSED